MFFVTTVYFIWKLLDWVVQFTLLAWHKVITMHLIIVTSCSQSWESISRKDLQPLTLLISPKKSAESFTQVSIINRIGTFSKISKITMRVQTMRISRFPPNSNSFHKSAQKLRRILSNQKRVAKSNPKEVYSKARNKQLPKIRNKWLISWTLS